MCPNCGVYLIEKEEICPSCGHVMDREEHQVSDKIFDISKVNEFDKSYSGVPISKRVVSTPSVSKTRKGVRLLFLLLVFVPFVNIVASVYGAFSSKDPVIRRVAQVFLVIFTVIIIVLSIYIYEYGFEFVVDKIIAFIIK